MSLLGLAASSAISAFRSPSNDLAEIEVEGQGNASVLTGTSEGFPIGQMREPNVASVNGFVTPRLQPIRSTAWSRC